MDKEVYIDLLRYMENAVSSLNNAYDVLGSYKEHINQGLSINGVGYKKDEVDELRNRIEKHRGIVNNIIIAELKNKIENG